MGVGNTGAQDTRGRADTRVRGRSAGLGDAGLLVSRSGRDGVTPKSQQPQPIPKRIDPASPLQERCSGGWGGVSVCSLSCL